MPISKTRSSKKRREVEEPSQNQSRSAFDDLPDEVIHHILSFMPIKEVAQASLLSRRWLYIWSSYPFLDFKDMDSEQVIEFIKPLLAQRAAKSSIQKFRLDGRVTFSGLSDCIRTVVKHNLKELELNLSFEGNFLLPRCLFACGSSLKVLILSSNNSKATFRFPTVSVINGTGAKSLETMLLGNVDFMVLELANHKLFTASCFPRLKKLRIKRCKGVTDLNIRCPSLEDLKLENVELSGLSVLSQSLVRLLVDKCFSDPKKNSWVKISAPKLKNFRWLNNVFTNRCVLENSDCMSQVVMKLPLCDAGGAVKLGGAIDLLSILGSGAYVTIQSPDLLEYLSKVDLPGGLPYSFSRIYTLKLLTKLRKCDLFGLACLLRSCSVVTTFNVNVYSRVENDMWNRGSLDNSGFTLEQFWDNQTESLKSFLEHLKIVKIDVADGRVFDTVVSLAKFAIKYGKVVEQVRVTFPSIKGLSTWKETLKLLLSNLPKLSPNVEIFIA